MEPLLTYTSLNLHLPTAATSLTQPLDIVPIEAQYLNMDTLLFCKADRFLGHSSTCTVQNSLDSADAGMPLTQDCLEWLIDSIITLECTVLAFLAST